MNNSSSNIFKILLLLERYYQNSQVVLSATGMNGLNSVIRAGDLFDKSSE